MLCSTRSSQCPSWQPPGNGNRVTDYGPTTGSSDEVAVNCSFDKDPAAWYSDGELPSPCLDKDPAADAQTKDLHQIDAAPSGSSDGGFLCLTYNEDLGKWSFNGGLPQSPCNEDQAARSSDGGVPKDLTAATSAISGHTSKLLRRICKCFSSLCCCCRTSPEDWFYFSSHYILCNCNTCNPYNFLLDWGGVHSLHNTTLFRFLLV